MTSSKLTKVFERTYTDAQEQLQEGYVSAVAATAGATYQPVGRDKHKFDAELMRQPLTTSPEISVRVQLKATTDFVIKPGASHFDYRFQNRPAFDSLAMPRSMQKHILVVMTIHPDQNRWTYSHHRSLLLRHCCYWMFLEGQTAPASPIKPVVSVPLANVFNAKALTGILDRIEAGGTP